MRHPRNGPRNQRNRNSAFIVSVLMPTPMIEAMAGCIESQHRNGTAAPLSQSEWIRRAIQRDIDHAARSRQRSPRPIKTDSAIAAPTPIESPNDSTPTPVEAVAVRREPAKDGEPLSRSRIVHVPVTSLAERRTRMLRVGQLIADLDRLINDPIDFNLDDARRIIADLRAAFDRRPIVAAEPRNDSAALAL